MSQQSDLFNRAAKLEAVRMMMSDPAKRAALKQLRDMWIALANECSSLSARELAKRIAAIEEIQAVFDTSS